MKSLTFLIKTGIKKLKKELQILLKFFIFIFFQFFTFTVFSQNVKEQIFEAKSPLYNLEKARLQVFDQAIQEISLDSIQKLIGQDKLKSHKTLIENKIIKNSKKYILYMKEVKSEKLSDGIKITVLLKISHDSLRKLLLNEGLFYKEEGFLKVLPLIDFTDKARLNTLKWWKNLNLLETSFLNQESQVFHNVIKNFLREHGFFGLQPQNKGFRNLIPGNFHFKRGKNETDFLALGRYFNSSIVLIGDVVYFRNVETSLKQKISFHLKALQSEKGQVLGELKQSFILDETSFTQEKDSISLKEVYRNVVQDLFQQVFIVWKRGAYKTYLLKLSFDGELPYQKWKNLKNSLLDQVNELKNIRDYSYAAKNVTYEVDTLLNPKELAQIIDQSYKSEPVYSLKVSEIKENEIKFKISLR